MIQIKLPFARMVCRCVPDVLPQLLIVNPNLLLMEIAEVSCG
jgi:hypothetical protein